MAIYLIVGQPRHGKSQFSVKTADDCHKKNIQIQKKIDSGKFDESNDIVRQIYSDINGHFENTDYILKAPFDWRDVPDNSIVFMDEIHQRAEYVDNGRMQASEMITELRTHGHRNIDIYLITQDPQTLHKSVRALVEKMYLVKRPMQKPNFATIYEFERWLRDPWSAVASTRDIKYQDSYKFFYSDKWQSLYTSASAHTSISFKLQKKFYFAIAAAIGLGWLAWTLFSMSGGGKILENAKKGANGENSFIDSAQKASNSKPINENNEDVTDLNTECRNGENVEKPECIKFFNDLSNNNASISNDGKVTYASYNPDKPYDYEYYPATQPTDFPRISGVIKLKTGKLMAVDQQGNYMPNISQRDCKQYLAGYRPFDYFRKETTPSLTNNNTVQSSETSTTESSVKPNYTVIDGTVYLLTEQPREISGTVTQAHNLSL